jgi:hypothetical protein
MTTRGGGHPKQAMVFTPFSRTGQPPRSFAADAHDCIMVRPLWTYRIQGCGAISAPRKRAPLRSSSRHERAIVLEAVNVWPGEVEYAERLARRPTLTASPRAGLSEARIGAKKRL